MLSATTYICNHSFLARLIGTDSVVLILERITETSRTLLSNAFSAEWFLPSQ